MITLMNPSTDKSVVKKILTQLNESSEPVANNLSIKIDGLDANEIKEVIEEMLKDNLLTFSDKEEGNTLGTIYMNIKISKNGKLYLDKQT